MALGLAQHLSVRRSDQTGRVRVEHHGRPYFFDQIRVDLVASGGTVNPHPGGIARGGECVAYVLPEGSPEQQALFPGRLEWHTPQGVFLLENLHPRSDFQYLKLLHNGRDLSQEILELELEVTPDMERPQGHLVYYVQHLGREDEVVRIDFNE